MLKRTTLLFSVALFLLIGLMTPAPVHAQTEADQEAVRQAALDYVNALYFADSTLVIRSVSPELVKFGYYRSDGEYNDGNAMSYERLKNLAARWNANERRFDPETHPKSVTVFEVQDKTASAKITADWGTDYMLLSKVDGTWMIRQILWQSAPPTMAAADNE